MQLSRPIRRYCYDGVHEGNAKGIGGLIGRAAWETEIAVGYSQGDVTGPDNVGGIMGSSSLVDSRFESMYSTATVEATDSGTDGGTIVGIVQSDGDVFEDSLYWDDTIDSADAMGETETDYWYVDPDDPQTDWNEETTESMTGLDTAENMTNLDFEDTWDAVPDDYPRFEWESKADGEFEIEITDADNTTAGTAAEVTVTASYDDLQDDAEEERTISLVDPEGNTVDTEQMTIESGDEEEIDLVWQTSFEDAGEHNVTVTSADSEDTAPIEIWEADAEYGPGESDGPNTGWGIGEGVDDEELDDLGPGSANDPDEIDAGIGINVEVVEVS